MHIKFLSRIVNVLAARCACGSCSLSIGETQLRGGSHTVPGNVLLSFGAVPDVGSDRRRGRTR